MCGLFGFTGKLNRHQRGLLLRALCVLNSNRGTDSIGLACIDTNTRRHDTYRSILPPVVSAGNKEFARIADTEGTVWIGHTRHATRGSVTVENAHPYHIGYTIGAHNGMVTVDKELRDRCGGIEYPVDSQYLIHLLDRDGKVGEVSGDAALVFTQLKSAPDVSFIRFRRPLYAATVHKMSGIVWASEESTLRYSLAIAGIRSYDMVKTEDCTRYDVFLAADGTIADVLEVEAGISARWKYIGYQSQSQRTTYAIDYDGYDGTYSGADVGPYKYPACYGGKQQNYAPPTRALPYTPATGQGSIPVIDGNATPDDSTALGDALKRMAEEDRRAADADAIGSDDDTVVVDDPGAWGLPEGADLPPPV